MRTRAYRRMALILASTLACFIGLGALGRARRNGRQPNDLRVIRSSPTAQWRFGGRQQRTA